MGKDLSNEEFDYFLGNGEKQSNIVQEYDKTSKQKLVENWEMVKNKFEWGKLPSTLLVSGIMLIGGVLMATSIYSFTNNLVVAVLSPFLSEIGIISWSLSSERPVNTKKQVEISKFMRQFHIVVSVLLLSLNLILEASTQVLSLQIDGMIWAVFGIMGITSFFDIWNYYQYKDNERETANKLEFASRSAELSAETKKMKMQAKYDAEMIRANAELEFMKQYSPSLAKKMGMVSAAEKLKNAHAQIGMSADEVRGLFGEIDNADKENYSTTRLPEFIEQTSNTNQQPSQIKPKRNYDMSKRNKSKENQENKQPEENFQSGAVSEKQQETWE